jgi:hypothetical protein
VDPPPRAVGEALHSTLRSSRGVLAPRPSEAVG